MNELDFALQQAGAGDVDVVEQARTRAATQQRQVTSDDLSALQEAFTLPDDASDDAKAHAAGTISRVYFGQENYDGSIWTGGKPLKPAEYLSMMRDFVRGVAQPPNLKDLADFEALPDDEARFKAAQKKLGPFRRFREGVADLATSDFAPLAQAEEAGAPENVRAANAILSAYDPRRPDRPANPPVETGTPEYRKAAETVAAYREQLQKKNTISEYRAKLYAQNAWLQYDVVRASLTKDADDVVREAFAMNRLTPGMVEKFKTLPGDQQRLVAGLVHSAKHQGERRLAYDAGRTFVQMAVDMPVKAAQSYVVDAARRAFMDDEEYQRFAETRATLAQMEAPRMAEYGYVGQSVIGFAGTIPYMAAAMIPYAGTAMIAGQAAYDFEQRVAAEGGDVTSAKFQGAKWAMAVAYASVEKLQANRIAKPLTDLEKRQALCQFWRRANAPIAARILAGDTAFETAQEGIQKGIEDGFVAWGLGKDVAAAAAAGTVQEIKDTAGTMFLTSLAGAGGKSIHANVSKNHTLSEIAAGQYHASRLIEATAANDKEAVAKHRATLGSMQRAWRAAGTHENAVRMFTSRGVDPRAADALSRFFEWEYTSVMGDASLTADQKEALVGKDATLSGILQQLMPDATVGENSDGSLSVRRDLNGVRTTTRVQVGDMAKLDVASPEAAASISEALTAAGFKISPEEWLNMAESERRGMITDYNLRQEGQFKLTAEPTSETEGEPAEVTGQQLSALSGQIDLNAAARPAAVFHEAFHAFVRYLRAAKTFTDADVARLREEFGAPRPGVNEDFNEESAAEAFRSYAAGKVQMVQSTALEKAWDSLWDVLDRFGSLFRRREQVRTVRETLFQQLAAGTYTGIPVGTITEAQRQANAAKKAESARKRPAQKAQQAQEPSKAEKPPETTPDEKPPSGEPVAAKEPSDEEKAAAAAVEAAKGKKSISEAPAPIGKGEWRATTPQEDVVVEGEWEVRDLYNGIITSQDEGYADQDLQGRDRTTLMSRLQIIKISEKLNFSKVSDSNMTDTGAPIIIPQGSVLSGNGRILAMRRAIEKNTGKWDAYEASVRQRAAEIGIAIPDAIKHPVLVRRIDRIVTPGYTLKKVAELSNVEDKLQMSDAEVAQADAVIIMDKDLLKIFNPGPNGNLLAVQNHPFMASFVRATGATGLMDSKGNPNVNAKERVRRAMLALLVGNGENAKENVRALIENPEGIEREVNAILRASPVVVDIEKDRPQYSLSTEIADTLRALLEMKAEGSSPYQMALDRPAIVDMLMRAMWERRKRRDDIQAIFTEYASLARKVETSSGTMFDVPDSTKEELMARAIENTKPEYVPGKKDDDDVEGDKAEEPPAPPPTTQADKAKDKKDQPPVADESGTVDQIPPPSNVTIQPGQVPFGEIGKGWKKIITKVKEQLTEWSKSIPLFQGAKRAMSGRTTKAIRSTMSQAERDAVRTIWDGFGGSGGFGLYHALENFRNANLISIGEYHQGRLAKIKFFHQ
ncbi:MAG TPA: hypothetical protein P5204_08395, partial [Kiritimatiellia bacterium]|nr:hypothetical protein [Kiritimatiellia bacterium]